MRYVALILFFVALETVVSGQVFPMSDTNDWPDVYVVFLAPTNPIVAGFKVYSGTHSGAYTNVVDCGMNLVSGLYGFPSGAAYYFAATQYSAGGAESALSSEVAWTNYLYTPTNRVLYLFTNGIAFKNLTNVVGDHFFVLSNSLLVSLNSPSQKYSGTNARKSFVTLAGYEKIFYRRTP